MIMLVAERTWELLHNAAIVRPQMRRPEQLLTNNLLQCISLIYCKIIFSNSNRLRHLPPVSAALVVLRKKIGAFFVTAVVPLPWSYSGVRLSFYTYYISPNEMRSL